MRLRNPRKLGDTLESWLRQDGRTRECVASTWRYLGVGLLPRERVLGGAEGSSCSCLFCCSWSCCCVCLSALVDRRFLVDAVATVVVASDMVGCFFVRQHRWWWYWRRGQGKRVDGN